MSPEVFAILIHVCAQRQLEFEPPDYYRPVPALVECARDLASRYEELGCPARDPVPVPVCACDLNGDGLCGGAEKLAIEQDWLASQNLNGACPQ